jgi:hypothetical protein
MPPPATLGDWMDRRGMTPPPQWRAEVPVVTSADAVRVVAIDALRDELADVDEQMTALLKAREGFTFGTDFTEAYASLVKHRASQCARIERLVTGDVERYGNRD